jgi:hypothetical protein
MLAEDLNGAGFKEKRLVFRTIVLESTLPPHKTPCELADFPCPSQPKPHLLSPHVVSSETRSKFALRRTIGWQLASNELPK